jgi:hypothetical protein
MQAPSLTSIGAGMVFAASAGVHMQATSGAKFVIAANYTISGSAAWHMLIDGGAITNNGTGRTVTITGTPAFSQQFVNFTNLASVYLLSMTYSGSATGTRFSGSINAVCQTGGGGANYFPGSSAGSYGYGAQYV